MQAYDELRGSTGREIWYRPPRYDAHRLFPGTPPRVRARENFYQINNICLGGIAATTRQPEDDFEVGETLPISIQQSGIPIFESLASVCRSEKNVFGAKIAFKFVDGFIEFDKLLNRNLQAQIITKTSLAGPDGARLVPQEYRVLCADVLKLLRAYRNILSPDAAHITEYSGHIDNHAAFDACEDRLLQHWRSLWHTANDIVRTVMDDREKLRGDKGVDRACVDPRNAIGRSH